MIHRTSLLFCLFLLAGCASEVVDVTTDEAPLDNVAPPGEAPRACCAADVTTGKQVRCGTRQGKWCCDAAGGCSNCRAGHECYPPPK